MTSSPAFSLIVPLGLGLEGTPIKGSSEEDGGFLTVTDRVLDLQTGGLGVPIDGGSGLTVLDVGSGVTVRMLVGDGSGTRGTPKIREGVVSRRS